MKNCSNWISNLCVATLLTFTSIVCLNGAEPQATAPASLNVMKGFKVELLYSVPKDQQGSWVAMCVDDKGRMIASDQYGSLFRITPPMHARSATVGCKHRAHFCLGPELSAGKPSRKVVPTSATRAQHSFSGLELLRESSFGQN